MVSIRRTRQKQFVVTAFMRSFAGFRYDAPMNRGTTNGSDEYLLCMTTVTALCLVLVFCAAAHSAGAASLKDVKIVNDRAPDCSSLSAIVKSITRGCRSDDERAIAIYNFCRYAYYHHAYPSEPGGISALKLINVYGWSLCGGQHTVLAALWEAAGFDWRYRGWQGHTTVECFYNRGQ